MTELKPCPFCGGEAEMLTAESMNGGYLFCIMCNDCRSRGDVYDTEAEAIAAWNTRDERTCRDKNGGPLYNFLGFECTLCGTVVNDYMLTITSDDGYEQFNYCPNCGARVIKSDQ